MVEELCRFIGIPFDPSVFEFYKKQEETIRTYNNPLIERFHGSLMKPVNTGRMELYKTGMTTAEIAIADHVAGKYAGLFGYESKDVPIGFANRLHVLAMQVYGFLIFRLYVYGSYLPARLSLWLSVKLLVLVRAYSKLVSW
jgi:hypothetical protein